MTWHFDLASFLGGVALTAAWVVGVICFTRVFMTKPRSMKQVAGDNSTQIQVAGDATKEGEEHGAKAGT